MKDIIVEARHDIKIVINMEDNIIPAGTKGRVIDIQIDEDTSTMFCVEFEGTIEWLSAEEIVTER